MRPSPPTKRPWDSIRQSRTPRHTNLGNAFREKGQLDEAFIAAYRHFTREASGTMRKPGTISVSSFARRADMDGATDAYRRALEIHPNFATAISNLADAICHHKPGETAIPAARLCVELQPQSPWMHSNLIYTLHFRPHISPEAIREEQRAWNRKFVSVRQQVTKQRRDENPERRLRIGYVSADFRNHVVGRNILPLFKQRNTDQFEVIGYSGVPHADELTAEFRPCADQWRSTVGLTDQQVAAMIRHDDVDILVDLSQHLAGNRLPVFAQKALVIQVSFAGHPETTGLRNHRSTRISDRWLEGVGNAELGSAIPQSAFRNPHSVRFYLLDTFWCYDPCGITLATNELPARTCGRITFGCCNNFTKVNEPLLKLWARLLLQLPDSQLVILTGTGSHRSRIKGLARRAQDSPGIGWNLSDHDRAGNTWNYITASTLPSIPFPTMVTRPVSDALPMGVPVVSLASEAPVSRAGLSQLSNLGLPELVSFSEDDYVSIAVELANDLPRLADRRRTLRSRMESSVLMDAPRFARNIEAAYRAMWRHECAT